MTYIYIGDCVNTHGLKGEIRVISDFSFKENAFAIGKTIYITKKYIPLTITSYRKHKNYDMLTFEGLSNIEDVLIYKGEPIYTDKDTLEYNGYLDDDLIGLTVYNDDKEMGKVISIMKTSAHDILVIENGKRHMVPNIKEFVTNIDLEKKRIDVNYIEGLIDEN